MKKLQKELLFIILLGLFLNTPKIFSQNNNEVLTYNWFDKNLGIESLNFNNGSGHLNFDRTINDHHRYYNTNEFKNGNITYKGQNYYNIDLQYDIFNDQLIVRPYTESYYIQINLIKEKVDSFKIDNEKFVNLKEVPATFKSGYYEEVIVGNSNTALYIKHSKAQEKVIKDYSVFVDYKPHFDYLLLKDNKLTLINNKTEIVKLYPDQKRKINDFFLMNKDLKKTNQVLFMKNLIKYINNF